MKILTRHVLGEFARVLVLTLAAMLMLFFIVEVVERADDLLEKGMPLSTGLLYFLYKLPSLFSLTAPVAVLLAVLLSMGMLNRNGEITAVKASGIGLARLVMPLLLSGLLMTAAVILINETVVPHAERAVASLEARWLRKSDDVHMGRAGLWLRSADSLYNVRKVSPDRRTLEGVSVYRLGDGFSLREHAVVEMALWRDGRWDAEGARVWEIKGRGTALKKDAPGGALLSGLAPPDELLGVEKGYEAMSIAELGQYIEGLESDGYDTAVQRVELYGKLTFPFVNFIMVLVGIPFALKTGRKGGVASGVAISFVIGVGFWIVFGLSKSLGQTGVLPPIAAALFPDMLFLAIGIVMFGYVRQ